MKDAIIKADNQELLRGFIIVLAWRGIMIDAVWRRCEITTLMIFYSCFRRPMDTAAQKFRAFGVSEKWLWHFKNSPAWFCFCLLLLTDLLSFSLLLSLEKILLLPILPYLMVRWWKFLKRERVKKSLGEIDLACWWGWGGRRVVHSEPEKGLVIDHYQIHYFHMTQLWLPSSCCLRSAKSR